MGTINNFVYKYTGYIMGLFVYKYVGYVMGFGMDWGKVGCKIPSFQLQVGSIAFC